jgi:glutamate-1-semialdehyde 2,1-aminomutase
MLSNSAIITAYRDKTPASASLAARALEMFPSGVTHDARYLEPYGIYVERALGSRKWDVDGNEYVDYFGGHGALLLGHNHPEVIAAIHAAMDLGSHFGANHPYELRWAEAVQRLMPGAERLRFTSSGTEATLLALRLARNHTGKSKLIRLAGHFHGWHDHMAGGVTSQRDGAAAPGVVSGIADNVILAAPGDIEALELIMADNDDIAALILEPTGAFFGMLPLPNGYLQAARDLCDRHGVVLIFDEVVTGFRVAPGGAQGHYGVTPDVTAIAKILAGGLPGGAIVGTKAILDGLDFQAASLNGGEKVQHQGTFNANPVSAAAGVAALHIIATTDACERANAAAASLRAGINDLFEYEGVPWAYYGEFSALHLFTNPGGLDLTPTAFDPLALPTAQLLAADRDALHKFRLALLVNGIDMNPRGGGVLSAAHDSDDISLTIGSFRRAIAMLRREGVF